MLQLKIYYSLLSHSCV